MDENDYKNKFEALTEGMKYEQIYDALEERVNFVKKLTMHCGEIFKTAREAGLPRGLAERMALEYFQYETTPSSGMYVIESSEGEL